MKNKEIKFIPQRDGIISYECPGPFFGPNIGLEIRFDQTGDAIRTIEIMSTEERLIVLGKIRPVYERLLELLRNEN